MGAKRVGVAVTKPASLPESTSADEVNLEALSDEEIERLLGDDAATEGPANSKRDVS
jgi:hypothetical protein